LEKARSSVGAAFLQARRWRRKLKLVVALNGVGAIIQFHC
jgi:hypothetical protein